MTTTRIETEYGTIRTATRHPYIIVGRTRTYTEGVGVEFGEVFIEGYAATAGAAFKRVKREMGKRAIVLAVYHVPTGTEVPR